MSTSIDQFCLMSAPLGSLYTIDEKFLEGHLATGSTLISRHPTLTAAGTESCRLQLEQSQRVRDDAAALGGKLLLANIIAVTITYESEARRAQFHLTTPSGGVLVQVFKLSESAQLLASLSRVLNLRKPGVTLLPTPIPVTLRQFDQAVRLDAPVAQWRVVGVRSLYCLPVDELRPADVLVLDGQHWLIRDIVPNGVIGTRFTGGITRLRPGEVVTELTLKPGALYSIERSLFFLSARELARIATRQSATLVS